MDDNNTLQEVVIGVQFSPLPNLDAFTVGDIYQLFSAEYETRNEVPPLPPMIEAEQTSLPPQGPSIMFGPDLKRYWFGNNSNGMLIQLQADRFMLNWRRLNPEMTYPRYEHLKRVFQSEYSKFSAFAKDQFNIPLKIVQAEITYINFVDSTKYESILPLASWSSFASEKELTLDTMAANGGFKFHDANGLFLGRIYVTAQQVVLFSEPAQPTVAIQLEIGGRGCPYGEGTEHLFPFLDKHHEVLNRIYPGVNRIRGGQQ